MFYFVIATLTSVLCQKQLEWRKCIAKITDKILSTSPSKRDVVIRDFITFSSNVLKYYKRKLVTPQFSHEKKKDQLLPVVQKMKSRN